MKALSFYAVALTVAVSGFLSYSVAHAEAETKKVCVMQKDAKTGKDKEVCKNVKQHKKLEGTAVPPKK